MSDSEHSAAGAGEPSKGGDQRERPFKCTELHCTVSYARLEHLERHLRAHKGASYECDECHRTFARTDVLKRHKKLHLRDADPTQAGKDARKQAALERSQKACINCAASKVKCTGEPTCCERCRTLGKQCSYADDKRPEKRHRASSTVTSAEVPMSEGDLIIPSEPNPNHQFDFQLSGYPSSSSSAMQMSPAHGGLPQTSQAFTPNFNQFDQPYVGSNDPHGLNALFDPAILPGPVGAATYNFGGELPFGTNFCAISPEGSHALEMDAGLQLATDDSMFWSTFLSPQALNTDALGGAVARPASPHRGRIMITAAGLATRHGSPSAPEVEPAGAVPPVWPVWNPEGKDSGIMVDQVAQVAEQPGYGATIDLVQLVPKFDEAVRMSLLETLRFAQLSDHEYHSLYRTLSRIQLTTFDRLLSLYFTNFHYIVPFLHLPTFDPHRTLGFLLLMLLGIGAVHAPLPGALQLGQVLLEVGRRGIENLTNKDNRLARSVPMTQALMLWSVIKWLGSPRNLELSEVFRGTYTTQVRRLHVFDEPSPELGPHATTQERWESFVKHEEKRRTGMVCFLLECEFTTLLHIAPSLELSELKTTLPCARDLWIAQTAEAWDEVNKRTPPMMKAPALLKLISADSTFPLPASVRLSAFASHILVKGLHSLLHSAMQLQVLANVGDLASTNLRRSLGRIGRGSNEFAPDFGASEAELPRYAPACVSLHLAHIASYILLPELDLVAGRASVAEAAAMKAKITSWMISNRERAKTVALHAGQIVRLVREHPTWGTYESSSLFYASLVLYLYSRSLLASSPAPTTTVSYALDSRQVYPVDPSLFITTDDLPASLSFYNVGLLGDAAAPKKLLVALSGALSQCGAVWRVGQVLSSVLLVIAGQEGRTDASSSSSL